MPLQRVQSMDSFFQNRLELAGDVSIASFLNNLALQTLEPPISGRYFLFGDTQSSGFFLQADGDYDLGYCGLRSHLTENPYFRRNTLQRTPEKIALIPSSGLGMRVTLYKKETPSQHNFLLLEAMLKWNQNNLRTGGIQCFLTFLF